MIQYGRDVLIGRWGLCRLMIAEHQALQGQKALVLWAAEPSEFVVDALQYGSYRKTSSSVF
jgi:hypothetical protein